MCSLCRGLVLSGSFSDTFTFYWADEYRSLCRGLRYLSIIFLGGGRGSTVFRHLPFWLQAVAMFVKYFHPK